MKTKLRVFSLFSILLALGVWLSAGAQAIGQAEISHPKTLDLLSGTVEITGTATSEGPGGYELAFAYLPNPDDIWYVIAEVENGWVEAGVLATWDTTTVTDGTYSLRLRAWMNDGSEVVQTVSGLVLENASPTDAPAAAQASLPSPAPTQASFEDSPVRSHIIERAFMLGLLASTIALALLAVYSLGMNRLRYHKPLRRTRTARRKKRKRANRRSPR